MVTVLAFIIGLATGIISGFGIGGGSLLVLYLTAVLGVAQQTAGGMNLLYFIGCAPAALIGHVKNKRICWDAVIWCVLAGVVIAVPTALIANKIDTDLLRRMFGVVLLYVGVRELRTASKSGKSKYE